MFSDAFFIPFDAVKDVYKYEGRLRYAYICTVEYKEKSFLMIFDKKTAAKLAPILEDIIKSRS
ncbi:hypothetical protein AAIR98_000038 [Elusimicrobium simillimum]